MYITSIYAYICIYILRTSIYLRRFESIYILFCDNTFLSKTSIEYIFSDKSSSLIALALSRLYFNLFYNRNFAFFTERIVSLTLDFRTDDCSIIKKQSRAHFFLTRVRLIFSDGTRLSNFFRYSTLR
jgi:hypothetical protein